MKYDITNTGDYLLIVDDNSIIAKKGQWVLETHNYTNPNTISEISGDWNCNRNGYKDKIILAHLPLNNSPILEGVDLLPPLEDEAERLAIKAFPNPYIVMEGLDITPAYKDGFEVGYNTAKETYNYTEKDLTWAIQEAYGHGQNDEADGVNNIEESIKSIKTYLQQPKTPVAFLEKGAVNGTWVGEYIY